MTRRLGCLSVAALLCGCAEAPEPEPLAREASSHHESSAHHESPAHSFRTGAESALAPSIDQLVVQILDSAAADSASRWVRVDARFHGLRVFGYEMLVDDVEFLDDPARRPGVRRYILYPASGPPREFADARDGAARTPDACLENWWPRPVKADSQDVLFLGRTFVPEGAEAPTGDWPRDRTAFARLDSEFLIATSRSYRDDGRGRAPQDDYQWTQLQTPDYTAMLGAGFNLFPLHRGSLDDGLPLPAFLVVTDGFAAAPEIPLLGNFLGAVLFSDEPAVQVMRGEGRAAAAPAEFATMLLTETRRTHRGAGKYGAGYLEHQLHEAGLHYGPVRQPPYPAWEAIASAAWYELEAGAAGTCLEARLRPDAFAQSVESTLGVDFPSDPVACIRLHFAILRGAARRFGAPWGVSVFGQMDPGTAELLLPMAYDSGATYFWFWTSDFDHHVPHDRQLQLAAALRDHASAHPRGPMPALLQRAAVALVLPWGYAFDEFSLAPPGRDAFLWGVPGIPLDAQSAAGARHRDVLRAAAKEAAALLVAGTEFDVLFLRDREEADGYREVRRVREDGTVASRRR